MKPTTTSETITSIRASAVIVGHFEGTSLSEPAAQLDQALGGGLSRLCEAGEVSGKLAKVTTLLAPTGIAAERVVVVGLGPREEFDRAAAFRSAAAAAKQLAATEHERLAFFPRQDVTEELIESGVCGALVGCQGQDLYRAKKNLYPAREQVWATEHVEAIRTGAILADSINLTRRLVNEPASKIYPESFAACAEEVAQRCHLELEVWDESRLEQEKCGCLLEVSRGSKRPPRLVILNYSGAAPETPVLGLVGKGVTFDSGGLSLKPSDGMQTMKCDMAGAATVLGAMQAIAQLQLPVNVVALMGLVENMVSGDSYKLGDVLTARSGKTVEVLNTDAEGRLVLADVLDVAIERGAMKLVDLATLTGACVVALGKDVTGVMSNDQAWCDEVLAAARVAGEPAWQLPMFDSFGEQIKSKVADIKNIGEGRWGGAITAAKFLEEFVGTTSWVHLDIAGPSFLASEKSWIDAGASGAFVRTLVELARRHLSHML
jgi:leucyl aminopeptidase